MDGLDAFGILLLGTGIGVVAGNIVEFCDINRSYPNIRSRTITTCRNISIAAAAAAFCTHVICELIN
jgi:hypothetical protein